MVLITGSFDKSSQQKTQLYLGWLLVSTADDNVDFAVIGLKNDPVIH